MTLTNPAPSTASDYYIWLELRFYHRVGTPLDRAVLVETSKELSSMPKLMQQQQYEPSVGYVCLEKKRVGGEIIGYKNGRIDKSGERSPIKGSSFLGLNRGNNIDLYGQMGGFNARTARSAFYANHNQGLIKVCFLLAFCPSVLGSKWFTNKMYARPESTNKKDAKITVIAILCIGGCSFIVLIIAICIMCYRSTKRSRQIHPEPEEVNA